MSWHWWVHPQKSLCPPSPDPLVTPGYTTGTLWRFANWKKNIGAIISETQCTQTRKRHSKCWDLFDANSGKFLACHHWAAYTPLGALQSRRNTFPIGRLRVYRPWLYDESHFWKIHFDSRNPKMESVDWWRAITWRWALRLASGPQATPVAHRSWFVEVRLVRVV